MRHRAHGSVAAQVPGNPTGVTGPLLGDGQARTPPMGFDNWNATHRRAEFNEAMVQGVADDPARRGVSPPPPPLSRSASR
ncbi:hypothetical protein ACFYO0_11505 [Streptomyces sp. NPDC006365]|uniref:hypothetical protein n=1 Tax=Streptomyces sp. NPDC006365 TaxID=3364744 RepID=UPI0036CA87E5